MQNQTQRRWPPALGPTRRSSWEKPTMHLDISNATKEEDMHDDAKRDKQKKRNNLKGEGSDFYRRKQTKKGLL